MINGMHALIYAKNAEKARAFFRDVLEWPHVDAGRGWLIFALPPGEIAAHPGEGDDDREHTEIYFMCDDVHATVAALRAKGVEITKPIEDHGWGIVTAIRIPGAGEMGLYQPRHPVAYGRRAKAVSAKKTKGSTKKAKNTATRKPVKKGLGGRTSGRTRRTRA